MEKSNISLPFPCGVVFEDFLERQLTHPFGMLGALIFFFPPLICFSSSCSCSPTNSSERVAFVEVERERVRDCVVHVWELGKRNSSSVNRKTETRETAIL